VVCADVWPDYERVVPGRQLALDYGAAVWNENQCPYMAERKHSAAHRNFQLIARGLKDGGICTRDEILARAYVYESPKACDRGDVTAPMPPPACLYASEEAMKQAHQAVQGNGGGGLLSDNPWAVSFREAKLMEIGQGPRESVVCWWPAEMMERLA